jgi:transcriptional regulator with XRE-family HTH domain
VSLTDIFGANLRHHRKAGRLTQADLAEQVGLSMEMISKIERGVAAPSFSTIERLAEVLEVPEGAFFGVGLIVTPQRERTHILSKIQTKLSKMNEDQLIRGDKMLDALFG